jgi:DNA-binding transcriptional MerR regulator
MMLTPGQVRELLQLSQDSFRHWKKVLPPLRDRNGYRPCFSFGDLLAMAFIQALTDEAGIRVSNLQSIASALFEQCGVQSWAAMERSILVIRPASGSLSFAPEPLSPSHGGVTIFMPCGYVIAKLRQQLLTEQVEVLQGILRFPPTILGDERRRSGTS